MSYCQGCADLEAKHARALEVIRQAKDMLHEMVNGGVKEDSPEMWYRVDSTIAALDSVLEGRE